MAKVLEVSLARAGDDYTLTVHLDRSIALDAGRCRHVREGVARRVVAELAQLAPGSTMSRPPEAVGGDNAS